MTVGVARTKLVARLASPRGKPAGVVVVPEAAEWDFVGACPLRSVPGLQQKTGEAVERALAATSVAELRDRPASAVAALEVPARVDRFDTRATESFGL